MCPVAAVLPLHGRIVEGDELPKVRADSISVIAAAAGAIFPGRRHSGGQNVA